MAPLSDQPPSTYYIDHIDHNVSVTPVPSPTPHLTAGNQKIFENNFINKRLSVYYQNVRGIRTKTAELLNNTSSCCFDMIALTETWLNPSIFDNEFMADKYSVFRADRDFLSTGRERGGGVLLAVDKKFCSREVQIGRDSLKSEIDIVGVKVSLEFSCIYVFVLYLPSPINFEMLESLFDCLLLLECIVDSNICILGDFNITAYADFAENNLQGKFCSVLEGFMNSLNFRQDNQIKNSYGRILDLVVNNNEQCRVQKSVDVLLEEDNHHPALFISLKYCQSRNFKRQTVLNLQNAYNFKKGDFMGLYNGLIGIDWSYLEGSTSVEDSFSYFYNTIFQIMDSFVPKFKKIPNRNFPPWFSKSIICDLKLKHKYFKRYKRYNSPLDLDRFKALREKTKLDISNSYKEYRTNVESNIKRDPKTFWNFVKNKKISQGIPRSMYYNNLMLDNTSEVLNGFAEYFQKSFTPNISRDVNNDVISCAVNINFTYFSESEVLKSLQKLKPKFTTGPDLIPAFIIKDCKYVFVKPLLILFNTCLRLGSIPSIWKVSKVRPVFKKGDRSKISNYRPVSIICNFCKVFEFLVYDRLFPLTKNMIIPQQHGFFAGRSTITNLVIITQEIAEAIDSGYQIDVVYLDFTKAFDQLNHEILLNKLNKFGFSHSLIKLLSSYLCNRSQYVELHGSKSNSYNATSGVPQGSVLGPLLFNYFINDIGSRLNCDFLLYADDVKLYTKVKSNDDCEKLQYDLNLVDEWCSYNGLKLNIGKCNVMSFTNKINTILYDYCINNNMLLRVDSFKDLGITFDPKLSFNLHVDIVVSEACKAYGFILRSTKDFQDTETLKLLYYSFVRSKLEYGGVVWSPNYNIHIDNLEKVQRKFLKYLCFKCDAVYPPQGVAHNSLLQRFNFESLQTRRKYFSLMMLFNLLHNNIDCSNLLHRLNFLVPRINQRHHALFYLPVPRTNVLKFSPIYNMCNFYDGGINFDIFNIKKSAMCRILDH